jgi:hypothetical protein
MAKKLSKKDLARLDALIAEATIDCYNEDEAHVAFMTTVEENVVCPFKATVIGEDVEVVELCPAQGGFGVDAVCRHPGKDYRIPIHSLEWRKQKPEGHEWIEAYRAWQASAG